MRWLAAERTRAILEDAASTDAAAGANARKIGDYYASFMDEAAIEAAGAAPLKPELAAIAPHVRTWRSRYTPPAGDEDTELSDSPDLGPLFEFQPRTPGACPGLDRVHCFNYPAALSHGTVSGDIPAISDGALRLAQGLAAAFYREDIDLHLARMRAFVEPELVGDEWQPADTAAVLAQRAAEDGAADLQPTPTSTPQPTP